MHLPELDPKKNVSSRTINAILSANGDAKLDLDFDVEGADASGWRRRYHAEATRRDRINGDFGPRIPGVRDPGGGRRGDHERSAKISRSPCV